MSISRRKFLKYSVSVAGVSVAAVAGAAGFVSLQNESNEPVIERVQIPVKNLKSALEGFTIVSLSDFHLYPLTTLEMVRRVVTMANSLKPDLVLLVGDYVTRDAGAIFDLAPLLSGLNAKYGVFSVMGNHDLWHDGDTVKAGLREARLPLLVNQGLSLTVNGELLNLAGVDDAWNGQPDIQSTLADLPPNVPTILMSHEPDPADNYAGTGRVALQLSGHSHGGQIRLPGKGALVLPWLGEKYDQGLYRVNDMWLYTTRGVGVVVTPVRLNCPPEVTEITLVGG